jgi:transposase-like protein
MTADDTIRQQAHKLVNAHGVDAPIQAAMQAQALLDQGDRIGSTLWKRIGNMTNVLLSKTVCAATLDSKRQAPVEREEPINKTPKMSDLPTPDIKRWHFQHKALVVTAVRTGLISVADACTRYSITIEELLSWKRLLDEHGLRGLRATRLQEYRQEASRAPRNSGHLEEVKIHGSKT